jgi:hypothetical protein
VAKPPLIPTAAALVRRWIAAVGRLASDEAIRRAAFRLGQVQQAVAERLIKGMVVALGRSVNIVVG